MSLLTDLYFKDVDFDQSKFKEIFSPSQQSEADIEEDMQFTLEGNMFELDEIVNNFAPQDEHAATLKAMLLAYWYSQNARTQEDRDIHMADFYVFAKSHANVAISAVRESVVNG